MAQTQQHTTRLSFLSVVWYRVLPPLFGGQKGVAFFMEHLARQAPLTCLCSRTNQSVPAAFIIDNSLPVSKTQFLNPLCWMKIYRKAGNLRTTHLIVEFPYYGIAGWLCKQLL